jgi:hypothetical protein
MKSDTAATPERLDARACASSYVVLGVIFGFIFGFGIWQATVPGGDWRFTVLTGAAFLLTMLWVGTIRIQYSNGQLSYHTLFTGTRSIPLSEIESAETKVVSSSKGSSMILLIHLRGDESQKPMAIKIKLFSKEDVGRLFDLLGPKFKSSRQIGIYTDESA